MYDSDSIMICITPIPSVENNWKNIYPGGTLWDKFIYEYYNENNDNFGLLFQKYTASVVDKFYHPSIINECKWNMNKSYYEDKHDLGCLHAFWKYLASSNCECRPLADINT